MSGKAYEVCTSCGHTYNVSLFRKKTDVYICEPCEAKQAARLIKKRDDRNKHKRVRNQP